MWPGPAVWPGTPTEAVARGLPILPDADSSRRPTRQRANPLSGATAGVFCGIPGKRITTVVRPVKLVRRTFRVDDGPPRPTRPASRELTVSRLLFIALTLLAAAGCPRASNPPQADQSHENSELIATTVQRILEHHGDGIDAADLPHAHRVVLMVYHAHVVLMDGGIYELFTSAFPGDPDYQLTAQAFDTIGATAAVEAIRLAFSIFPDAVPPGDFDERIEIARSGETFATAFPEGQSPDAMYRAAAKEVVQKLETFVLENEGEFALPE